MQPAITAVPCAGNPSNAGDVSESTAPPIAAMGFHHAQALPGTAARPEQLRALEALLVRLQDRGWIAREVLIDGFWEPCPSISTTAEACARLERPVVRFLRNGNDTSAIRFDWIFPDQIQVNDHTSSYAFGEEVKASLLAVAQAG
jgi:hypothetical protein